MTTPCDIINRYAKAREMATRYCGRIKPADQRGYASAFMEHAFNGAPCPSAQGIGECTAWCIRMAIWQCKDIESA